MSLRASTATLLLAALLAVTSVARAGNRYVISIGHNGAPAGASLAPLRYADDDAFAFYDFASKMSRQSYLLSDADPETRRRLGDELLPARLPSLAMLEQTVAEVRHLLEADASAGIESSVLIYYSGHGALGSDGQEAALTLADQPLTRAVLYDRVLAQLPAKYVHLFVDACHAEAIVRPRDAQARVVDIAETDIAAYGAQTTLRRFPQVGAVIATASEAQSHEWEAYQGGVFTHELLSALRGGADVNNDGRVEYSELAAFLSAANHEVRDPRARLQALVRPPLSNPRAPLVVLADLAGTARLFGHPGRLGDAYIEDESGARLLDIHAEMDQKVELVVPAGHRLYFHSHGRETELRPSKGARVDLDRLSLRVATSAPRGSLESALREGLFVTAFGRAYYRGFVDSSAELAPVSFVQDRGPGNTTQDGSNSRWACWATLGASGALAAGAGVFGVLAMGARSDFDDAPTRASATGPAERYQRDTTAAAILGTGAVAVAGAGIYLLLWPGQKTSPTTATTMTTGTWRLSF